MTRAPQLLPTQAEILHLPLELIKVIITLLGFLGLIVGMYVYYS